MNRPEARFCSGCGVTLKPVTPVNRLARPQPAPSPDVQPENTQAAPASRVERRQLTLMFCDLVGWTSISTRLDVEDLRDIIQSYQALASSSVARYDGVVSRFMGDGVFSYFGYPQAHENDAERAVLSGLEIVSGMRQLDAKLGRQFGVELAVRVGIATGPVVVGDLIGAGTAEERAVVGKTPNLASRIETIANPNSVFIAGLTRQLVKERFAMKSMGTFALKGFDEPVEAWQVLGSKKANNRYDAINVRELSNRVSRDAEIEALMQAWQVAQAGQGSALLVKAEAGFGKSHLLQVLKDRLRDQFHSVLECQCSPFHSSSAFYPVIDVLSHQLKLNDSDPEQTRRDQLHHFLCQLGLVDDESFLMLASLLSVPVKQTSPPVIWTANEKKHKTLTSLSRLIRLMSGEMPLLLILEDMHWVDPSTLELLTQLLRDCVDEKMLLVLTCRPEFNHSWAGFENFKTLSLARLNPEEAGQLVENIARPRQLSPQWIEKIVERGDGIPLFIEEITRVVLSQGQDEQGHEYFTLSQDLDIPVSLRDSLTARLDHLGEVKPLAQLAATIGRTFTFNQLYRVANLGADTLRQQLTRLCASNLVYEHGSYGNQAYTFKHALIQDAAYESLLKSQRREYHALIATEFEISFSQICKKNPELLAHHFTRAHMYARAIDYWFRAGKRDIARSANSEAVEHLYQGIRLLELIPDSTQKHQQELKFQVALGTPLIGARSYAAPEIEKAYSRALELCDQLHDQKNRFRVLTGLSSFYLIRAKPEQALEIQQRCLDMTGLKTFESLKTLSCSWAGTILFYLNRQQEADRYLQQASELYQPEQHHKLGYEYGLDPLILCQVHRIWLLWLRGDVSAAMHLQRSVNDYASQIRHPLSSIHAANFEVVHYFFREDYTQALDKAEALLELSKQHRFPHYIAYATIMRGSALAATGTSAPAIAEIEKGIRIREQTGAALALPTFLGQLARALAANGDLMRAGVQIARAYQVIEQTGESWWLPEILRLDASILLQRAAHEMQREDYLMEARSKLLQSIELSSRQGFHSLVFRAENTLGQIPD